jgi:type IV pilus biogenesis protein CpaD/CtpE
VKAARALRGAVVVVVAALALGLSGCASADTAAIVDGHRISERDAQEAARQIQ